MKYIMILIILFIAVFTLGMSAIAIATPVEDYSNTINTFRDSPNVKKFFKNSYGYAVFPNIGKAAYVIGGSYGKGQVYRNGKVTGISTVIEGSIGYQGGGEAFSEIIFFQDKRAYDEFTSGNFEFGADAQVLVVTAGAEAQAGTSGSNASVTDGSKTEVQAKTDYVKGMATFVHPLGGLMAGVSVGGEKFTFEHI